MKLGWVESPGGRSGPVEGWDWPAKIGPTTLTGATQICACKIAGTDPNSPIVQASACQGVRGLKSHVGAQASSSLALHTSQTTWHTCSSTGLDSPPRHTSQRQSSRVSFPIVSPFSTGNPFSASTASRTLLLSKWNIHILNDNKQRTFPPKGFSPSISSGVSQPLKANSELFFFLVYQYSGPISQLSNRCAQRHAAGPKSERKLSSLSMWDALAGKDRAKT